MSQTTISPTKSLSNFTLAEVKLLCQEHDGNCDGCPFDLDGDKGCCLSNTSAANWNLPKHSLRDQQIIAMAKSLGAKYVMVEQGSRFIDFYDGEPSLVTSQIVCSFDLRLLPILSNHSTVYMKIENL